MASDRTYYRRDCQELDYTFNWTTHLAKYSDTIASYTLTLRGDTGDDIVIVSDSEAGNIITYWITGVTGAVHCEIVTVGGRTDCRTAEFIAR